MANPRVRWMLVIVAVLAALRLVIVPWVNMQNEERQQLELLTHRLDRATGVVGNKDAILAARAKLTKETAASRAMFPAASEPENFRLDAQRNIVAIATGGGLKVSLFDWILNGEVSGAGLAYGRASVKLEGPFDRLISVHGELEGSLPHAAIREFNVSLRTPVTGPSNAAAIATIIVDLFYRPAAQPPAQAPPAPAAGAS